MQKQEPGIYVVPIYLVRSAVGVEYNGHYIYILSYLYGGVIIRTSYRYLFICHSRKITLIFIHNAHARWAPCRKSKLAILEIKWTIKTSMQIVLIARYRWVTRVPSLLPEEVNLKAEFFVPIHCRRVDQWWNVVWSVTLPPGCEIISDLDQSAWRRWLWLAICYIVTSLKIAVDLESVVSSKNMIALAHARIQHSSICQCVTCCLTTTCTEKIIKTISVNRDKTNFSYLLETHWRSIRLS